MDASPNMTAALIKRGNLDTKNAQGEHNVKMKGEMGDVSTSQGMPNITSKYYQKRAHGPDFPSQLKGNQPC